MNKDLLEKVSEASLAISGLQPRDNIYDSVCELAIKTLGLSLVWLGIVPNGDDGPLPISGENLTEFTKDYIRFTWGFSATDPTNLSTTPLNQESVSGLHYPDEHQIILDQGTCWLINDIAAHTRYPDWRDAAQWLGFQAALGQPLVGPTSNMIGVMHLYSKQKGAFTDDLLRAIQIFANLTASAIEIRQILDSLENTIRKRTAELHTKNKELERFNKLFINRELRMIELKKEIVDLQRVIARLQQDGEAS